MNRIAAFAAGLALSAGMSLAAEKTVMHCFAFTPIKEATQADWSAFAKATDALPGKIKGIKRVWHGKLRNPLQQVQIATQDAEARKKLVAAGQGNTDVRVLRREHGVCMEFADMAAFQAYDADPAHKDWVQVYSKVRVAGTTTYQIIPE